MEVFDAFLMTKHNVTPPCLVDTMAESDDQDAKEDSSATGIGNI